MNIFSILGITLAVYLLLGLIRFCLLSFDAIKKTNLKLNDIKKINFGIQIDGQKYKGPTAVVYFILLWPTTFDLKRSD